MRSKMDQSTRASDRVVAPMIMVISMGALLVCSPVFAQERRQPQLGSRAAPPVAVGKLKFRDLNRDGMLAPYEDWRLTPAERARDLVIRMTVQEKAGTVIFGGLATKDPTGMGAEYRLDAAENLIAARFITALGTRADAPPAALAAQHNRFQEIAEKTRLGIPLILATDPRHHFFSVIGASNSARYFSQWPDAPGLGAIDDPKITRRFADIARQEYRAVGLHMTLSPQADLASEPRWTRVIGTFGDNPDRVAKQVAAYVEGFQNGTGGLGSHSVISVIKHWVGYGAAKEGYDSHNYYGRFADLRGNYLAAHIRPFEAAFRVNVATVMPTYSILEGAAVDGLAVEPIGAGFSRPLVTDLLRRQYGFKGVVLSDSAITEDCLTTCMGKKGEPGRPPEIGMPWGVENLSRTERAALALNAGVDQILGLDDPEVILNALRSGLVTEKRIDAAVTSILEQRFAIGLFENPYVDPDAAAAIVGSPPFRAAALDAQQRSFVWLERKANIVPIRPGTKLFLRGVNPKVARDRGFEVTDRLEDADIVMVRAATPFQTLYPNFFISRFQHSGDLDFKSGNRDLEVVNKAAAANIPVIVDANLERPAILTPIRDKASILLGSFGATDGALFDILTGRAKAQGRLPFELPSSMDAVRAQRSDAPHDSANPLYPSGYKRFR
ncbi:beta-glucosidase [Sphingobium sp. AP50]|uniref:glycoside hydrolase family 3 protein n=1 Tax=Sphingobium sp. AP50 TaxID=1884369 RepID=UPI0008B9B64E|nr:glycoside hydrolase family 3 N-terminal domain-containing protein [Sphingobium sp. AP50]SEK06570.1 beta-glucosidase [Sphingobium sp. AP50]